MAAQTTRIDKIYFLIHPCCWSMTDSPAPDYLETYHVRPSEWFAARNLEQETNRKQKELIQSMGPNEVLIIYPIGQSKPMLDLIATGLLKCSHRYGLLLRALGRPVLGLQVAQLAAATAWVKKHYGGSVRVQASGRVASMVALLTAARDPNAFATVTTNGLLYSIDDLVESHVPPDSEDYPLFCFVIREVLDIPDLIELLGKLPFTDVRHGPLTRSCQ